MPLKIAIDGRCLTDEYPGIGRYLFNLLCSLPEVADDAEISILTPTAGGNTRFDLSSLSEKGLRLIPTSAPIRGLRQQLELPREMGRLRPDVFHAPYFFTAYRSSCPMVVGLYDTIAARFPESLPSKRARLAVSLGLYFARRAAHSIITLSRFAKDDLVSTFDLPPERVVVTPGAPPTDFRPAAKEEIDELRQRLRLPERYALHVGTNKPHKNLERLLQAWAEFQGPGDSEAARAECGLVFAGAHNPRHGQPQAIAQRLGLEEVLCLGPVKEDDLAALYSGADFFVMPSLDEGFGLPILEAMACGTPVACSRSASLPEVAGHAAIYFDPLQPRSMVETLTRLFKNPSYRRVLSDRGRVRAGQLTWKHTARLTLDAYRRAADG